MIEVVHVYRDALFEAYPPGALPEGYVGSTVYPLMKGGDDGDGESSNDEHCSEGVVNDVNDVNDTNDVNDVNDTNDVNDVNDTNDVNDANDTNDVNDANDTNDINGVDVINDASNSNNVNNTPNTPNDTTPTPLPPHELDEQLTRLCLLVSPSPLSHAVPQRRLAVRAPAAGLQLPLQVPRRPRARRPPPPQRVL